jgi:hypothetical protein
MIRLALFLACLALPALAQQPNCGDRAKVVYTLANEWLEVPVWEGLISATLRWELWANPLTGTWTILAQAPGAPVVCKVQSGTAGEFIRFSALWADPA